MSLRNSLLTVALLLGGVLGISLVNSQSASASAGSSMSHCGSVLGTKTVYKVDGAWPGYYLGTGKYYRTQRQGDRNTCVGDVQRALNTNFCSSSTRLAVDNDYGPKTARAVTRLQQYMRYWNVFVGGKAVGVDGITGPQTFSILSVPYEWGLSGAVSC